MCVLSNLRVLNAVSAPIPSGMVPSTYVSEKISVFNKVSAVIEFGRVPEKGVLSSPYWLCPLAVIVINAVSFPIEFGMVPEIFVLAIAL